MISLVLQMEKAKPVSFVTCAFIHLIPEVYKNKDDKHMVPALQGI